MNALEQIQTPSKTVTTFTAYPFEMHGTGMTLTATVRAVLSALSRKTVLICSRESDYRDIIALLTDVGFQKETIQELLSSGQLYLIQDPVDRGMWASTLEEEDIRKMLCKIPDSEAIYIETFMDSRDLHPVKTLLRDTLRREIHFFYRTPSTVQPYAVLKANLWQIMQTHLENQKLLIGALEAERSKKNVF